MTDVVRFFGSLVHETEKAFLIHSAAGEVWIPKSQVSFHSSPDDGGNIHWEIPLWLAEKNGIEEGSHRPEEEIKPEDIPF